MSLELAWRELKGSSEKITDSLSFELQKWFSSQNWFLSTCELHFAPAGSLQLRAVLACSRQLGALNDTKLLIFSHSYFNKVLNFYEEKGWLPNGVSIEIVDYEDSKGTRFERNEEKVEHTSTSDEASRSGSLTSSSGSELEGFDLIFGDNQNQETFRSVESWTCYHHFKKFNIKFVLQEGIVKTARKIMTEESSIER